MCVIHTVVQCTVHSVQCTVHSVHVHRSNNQQFRKGFDNEKEGGGGLKFKFIFFSSNYFKKGRKHRKVTL